MVTSTSLHRLVVAAATCLLITFATPGVARAQAGFSKAFSPSTIGPGSVSTLVFTINAIEQSGATNLAFVDTLPAGVTIATPANPTDGCNGALVAADGGSTITFSGGVIASNSLCTISVDVTSSAVGPHTNVSGDLTSTAGNSGPASADLIVATDRPGFSKSFSPATISRGSRSTLTFTIDNSANASLAFGVSFTDVLPGLVIADPSAAFTNCTGMTLTALPGTGVISTTGGLLLAGATCTIAVDVIGTSAGTLDNVTSELLSSLGGPQVSSGKASASLQVNSSTVSLIKSFLNDPVAPGGAVNLEFTIQNLDRNFAATGITFTDDLDATLSGLVATGLPTNNICGAGSQLSGTSLLTLTGGNLPAQGSCTFSVTLQMPAAATAGAYPNTTSTVAATIDGGPVIGSPASDDLFVSDAPSLTKSFLTDPVGGGDTTTVEFTLTNSSATSAATAISFTDNLGSFLSGVAPSTLPAAGFCGGGSSIGTASVGGDLTLFVSNASLVASASCTFSVDLLIPPNTPAGTYLNTTSTVTGTVDGTVQTGQGASDTLTVVAAPLITKEFTDDPVQPGGTATLEFTLELGPEATADATAISFTDDLAAALSGLTATGLPVNDVCGAGSVLSGTTNLSLTGGTLTPGTSCTFSVTLDVPAAAIPGSYTNTTSNVIATVSGVGVTGAFAQDELQVAGLQLTKQFTDDPVIPGGTVTLEFTIANTSATSDATNIVFTDNLSSTLAGLTAVGLPANDICGTGSQISGTTNLVFTGGNLTATSSCTFSVTLQVPGGAADGTYFNATSNLTADIGGSPATLDPANDSLVVDSNLLQLTKTFTDDPTPPGGTVTLEFTLTNLDATQAATAVTFSDDLDAALSGLIATGLPANDVCGTGSQIAGTSLLTLTGGSLAAGGSCTFSVNLQVPAGASIGTTVVNTTSQVTGTIGGLGVTGLAASDTLRIQFVTFDKAFDGPSTAGGTPILTFQLSNQSASSGVTSLSFLDDLDAEVPGLIATGLPMSNVCGAGSTLSGTSVLTLTGAALLPNGSCTINVPLLVPPGTAAGTYPNTTSDLQSGGLTVAPPAAADLVIEPPPTFAKAFNPATIGVGQASTLTFTIDNSASAVAASGLTFNDNLPAGTVVATPSGASTTCTGGSLAATPGGAVVNYSGGAVGAGASCTVQVNVTGTAPGNHVNTTGALTSSSGSSGTATATLTVVAAPGFAKAFVPAVITLNGTSTLTFTIDNSASPVTAATLSFSDNFPTGMVVATPTNASTTCTGGTLTAVAASGGVSYTGGSVAAGASCTLQVDVTATTAGSRVNTSSPLSSSLGASPVASDTLDVVDAPLAITTSFLADPVLRGGTVDLQFTLTNLSPTIPITTIAFTDDLDAALAGLTAVGLPANDVCGAGSQISGTSILSLTGGNLGAGGSCTFAVTVVIPPSAPLGTITATTSAATGQVGGSPVTAPPASAMTTVVFLDFTKTFTSSAAPGGLVTLSFTLLNPDPVNAVQDITFTDDLDAVLPGLTATGLPAGDVCGAGSQLAGTSVLSLTGGNLGPGGSCTFDVTLQLPDPAAGGLYVNTTSPIDAMVGGSQVAGGAGDVATAPLQVGAPGIPATGLPGLALVILAMATVAVWTLTRRR
jgi:uncharacterized repeat protein (TIGR01451 family)